jgi:phosphomannomutase
VSISFGTDGWRAVLGKDFNGENVERVTMAIGKYVAENFGYDKPILVGYDPRKSADEYAGFTANVLKAKGFQVYFSSRVVPTPVLAYNAKIMNACAIMFTASHNPPEYLGMKFIPDYAGPATSEITDEILNCLDKGFPSGNDGAFIKTDFSAKYYEQIEKIIDFEKIKL